MLAQLMWGRQFYVARVALLSLALTAAVYIMGSWRDGAVVVAKGKEHVLVTGGAGFIGSHATLALLEAGHSVTILDNLSRGNAGAVAVLRSLAPRGRLRFVHADLGDPAAVAAAFAGGPRVTLVIHFAAVAFVAESVAFPLLYYRNITANTVTLLSAMQAAGVHRLVFSSTCATYGNPTTLPITESTPTAPINPYGKAKLQAEDVIRDWAAALPLARVAILRYFNVIGADPAGRLGEWPRPEMRRHGRVSTACYDAAQGYVSALTIYGTDFPTADGTCVRDYVHVTDLVSAHLAVVPRLANPPVLYNVGTGRGNSVREFVDTCLKVTGKKIAVVEQAAGRPGDYAEVFANVSKIEAELGWKARFTDLRESLGHAWAWRSKHPHGY